MRYWMLMALFVGTLAYGCGKQGEGQRCNTENNDEDCADGLSCVTRNSIQGAVCCPTDDSATDLACLDDIGTTSSTTTGAGGSGGGATGTGGTGGTTGTGGTGGTTGTGGTGGTGGTTGTGGAGGN